MPHKNSGRDGNVRGSNKPGGRVIVVSNNLKQIDAARQIHYPWKFLDWVLGEGNVEYRAFSRCFLHLVRQEEVRYGCVFFDLPYIVRGKKGSGKKPYEGMIEEWIGDIKQARDKKYNLLNPEVPIYVYGSEKYRQKLLKAGATGFIVPKTGVAKRNLVLAILRKLGLVDGGLVKRMREEEQPQPFVLPGRQVHHLELAL